MSNIGLLYQYGRGVPQDFAKAHEWFEKAAAAGDVAAMSNIGLLYQYGRGVPQDFAKAREWFEKAAAAGDANARRALSEMQVREFAAAGQFREALHLQEEVAAEVEAAEVVKAGKPGGETARELVNVAWYALLSGDSAKALAASEWSLSLRPGSLVAETNRAHALMFLGRVEEARAVYLAHKDEPLADTPGKLWQQAIAEDFAELHKAGLTHPLMEEIEQTLGVPAR
jgi:TPR repeat protein